MGPEASEHCLDIALIGFEVSPKPHGYRIRCLGQKEWFGHLGTWASLLEDEEHKNAARAATRR